MKIVISDILTVEIDEVFKRIRVNDCVYSLDLLAGGMETPPGKVCTVSLSEPRSDGSREMLFRTQGLKP